MTYEIEWGRTTSATGTNTDQQDGKTGGSAEVIGYHTQELPDGRKLTYRMFSDGRVELCCIAYPYKGEITECGDDDFLVKDDEMDKDYTSVEVVTVTMNGSKYSYPAPKIVMLPGVDRVIFNPPATIVYWNDLTRTVVKCQDGELFDEETGFVMAFVKKVLGDRYKSVVRKSIKNAYRQMTKKTGSPVKSGTDVLGVSGSYRNIGVSLDDCLDQMSGFINSGEKDV